MPPRDPQPAISRRKSKLKLDVQEPALTKMLEKYCDLRRRGFGQKAIQTKSSWTRNHQKILLEEAQRRAMPGSQKSQEQAVTEWLLAIFDAGTELRVIQRTSALSNLQTKKRLETALDAASGPAPTGLIVRNPDGTPARVSWLDPNGNLMHRPFDGALPANTPQNSPYGSAPRSLRGWWHNHRPTPVTAPTPCCSWQNLACTLSTTMPAEDSTPKWKKPKWKTTRSAPSS